MNVIAITGYNKPDLLYIYLEQIYKEDLSNFLIRFHTEEGYDKEEDTVISYYRKKYPTVDIKIIVKPKVNCPLIGYHNILSSYHLSTSEADEFVIVGEEDILPTQDYIRFNTECYKKFLSKYDRIFCIAHKRRPETELDGNPEILIGDYQCTSPSCISVNAIKRYILPYTKSPGYYKDPIRFNYMYFHRSRIHPEQHTHHDGALERIMDIHKLFVLKPDQARSMHVGLSGIFCKGTPPTGSLEEKINQWKRLLSYGGEAVRKLSNRPEDIVVIPFESKKWDNLELDLDRSKAKASSWWFDTNNEFKQYIYNENI